MHIPDYFEPVDLMQFVFRPKEMENKFAYLKIDKLINQKDLSSYDIAILGIGEERNTINKGTSLAPDKIRGQLYMLNQNTRLKIIDLGNLKTGKALKDTYIAIRDIVIELYRNRVIPVIIGGGQDLTYGIYLAYDKLNQPISLVSVDPKFDFGYKKNDFDSDSYLGQIILERGKNLFNYTNLGYQTYYCNKEELKLINKMNFDAFRLGYVRSNMKDIEPVLRDANILSIDISSIKQSDAPAHISPSPNGLYSEEICQLARYAGLSDNLSSFGIFELNPAFDANNQTAALAAQIIWFFIDGVNARQNDYPKEGSTDYTKHIVSFDQSNQNMIFYVNKYNERWWMEVPYPSKPEKGLIIACTYEDYKLACNHEIPERWLKTIQKLS